MSDKKGCWKQEHVSYASQFFEVRNWKNMSERCLSFVFNRFQYFLMLSAFFVVTLGLTWGIEYADVEKDPLARSLDELVLHGPRPPTLEEVLAKFRPQMKVAEAYNMSIKKRCFFGQHQEDVIVLQRFLGRVTGGFFVELGALDGVRLSVSLFFERYMNWSGLLIEGSPIHAALYYRHYSTLRPHSKFVAGAVCSSALPSAKVASTDDTNRSLRQHHYQQKETRLYVTKGGCTACSQMLDISPSKSQDVFRRKCTRMNVTHGEDPPDLFFKRIAHNKCIITPVSCLRLDDLLRNHCVVKVDLFILDVEEAEMEVLRTVDWVNGPPIHFFVVELTGTSETKDRQVRHMLHGAGYIRHGRIGLNEVWQLADFNAALKRHVQRMRHMPLCNNLKGDGVLYGPLADQSFHRRWTPMCLTKSITPESFFFPRQQWVPPFFTVNEVPPGNP